MTDISLINDISDHKEYG